MRQKADNTEKQSIPDKHLIVAILVLFLATFGVLGGYQLYTVITEGKPTVKTAEMRRKETIDGYENPEEVAEYVLYWIHQDDLDLALRGCAIEEIAQNFFLQSYCEILETFPYTDMLAPSDYESPAYMKINEARMTAVYSDMVEQCIGILGTEVDLEIVSISAEIPENADGYYYQDIRDICSIVGARDARNVVIQMLVDGVPRQMTITAARYRSHWKIIQFSAYDNYNYTEPQIAEYAEVSVAAELPIPWEDMQEQVLPCNYLIAGNESEKDPEKLIRKWFVYLQRGDIWKALSYCDLYNMDGEWYPDSVFFSKQSAAAATLQKIYYDLLLSDTDQMSWIYQNVKDEAVNLVSLLDTSNMVYTFLTGLQVLEEGENYVKYQVHYSYDRKGFSKVLTLSYEDGWKIEGIE